MSSEHYRGTCVAQCSIAEESHLDLQSVNSYCGRLYRAQSFVRSFFLPIKQVSVELGHYEH